LRWPNRFSTLGPRYFTELAAQALPEPRWIARSDELAADLGWPADWATRPDWRALEVFSGAATWPGMRPLASVYSGHQFGVWAGQLGDGRALLLGEVDAPIGPQEIQLKGSGLTPYSRMGDGRAVLRSSIREFLCSEAMHHLGIPTTRALAVIGSPLAVRREKVETGAVVTRVAPSFLRFGHFEHFAHTAQDLDALRGLVDFAIEHHFPQCREAESPVAALLSEVARRTAKLIAAWQAVGFCHGVMNTDNMSLLGLTIDYGPFGFLDGFDPLHVCNHSDHQGRYAYGRQPGVAWWNLQALATAMLPLMGDDAEAASDQLLDAIDPYRAELPAAIESNLRAKLGLSSAQEGDAALADDLLRLATAERTDYTILWRRLASFSTEPGADNAVVRDLFVDRAAFDAWAQRYAARLAAESSLDAERALRMNAVNPKFVLRNHLCESAIRAADSGDLSEIERLLKVLRRPFDEQASAPREYADFPPDWAQGIEVSCSS